MVLSGVAVCPGAPFLLAGVAEALAARMNLVVEACRAAVRGLPEADSVTLLTTGRSTPDGLAFRELPVGSAIPMTSVQRSDLQLPPINLPTSPPRTATTPPVMDPAVGTMVGAALLDNAGCTWPVTAVEVVDPAGTANMLLPLTKSSERVALLVIADGAACHGDDAPGRRDDRSTGFDAAISAALAAGSPAELSAACADRSLAGDLLASVEPLDVLARLAATGPPAAADVLFAGAPVGVGYWVANWRWTDR
ncbi:MAG: hypothetical protein ABWZ02_00990 [Nakamurella sp.]